jgi:hypothetical protein
LQLALFGPELEDVLLLPSEDAELDELLLSACAAVSPRRWRERRRKMLLVSSLKSLVRIYRKRPDAGPGATHASGVRYASAFALMLASVVAALLAVFVPCVAQNPRPPKFLHIADLEVLHFIVTCRHPARVFRTRFVSPVPQELFARR